MLDEHRLIRTKPISPDLNRKKPIGDFGPPHLNFSFGLIMHFLRFKAKACVSDMCLRRTGHTTWSNPG